MITSQTDDSQLIDAATLCQADKLKADEVAAIYMKPIPALCQPSVCTPYHTVRWLPLSEPHGQQRSSVATQGAPWPAKVIRVIDC